MPAGEVERYARFLAGVLFEQNFDNTRYGPTFCDPAPVMARTSTGRS
jgi:hypothetical protein